MALVIPQEYANAIITITNSLGGLSSKSSIGIGLAITPGWTQTDANRVANLFRDGLKGLWDSGWSVGGVKFLLGPAPYAILEDLTTEVGTATAADYASPSVALVVTKRTGVSGREYRGRFYLPGVPETLIGEDGVVNAGYLASVQASLDALRTSINADAGVDDMVLFHDTGSPAPGPTFITALTARTPVATMRPRQRR